MKTKLKGQDVNLFGSFIEKGTMAPDFSLTKGDLSKFNLADRAGHYLVLNIFPSIDTPVCSASVRKFNQMVSQMDNTLVLCISKDLPFAQSRFCTVEGIQNVIALSDFHFASTFGKDYGVLIADGPMSGLLARAIVVIAPDKRVIYTQMVPEITQEPDYQDVLKAF